MEKEGTVFEYTISRSIIENLSEMKLRTFVILTHITEI